MQNFININKFVDIVNLGFFTSRGGISKGDFNSLNCSKSNDDKKNNVSKNIKIALNALGIEKKKLKLINQIHSNKIFFINKNNLNKDIYGDGLITENKNIALGILTADCAPIFIFDKKKSIVCCLHSGWKGALNNIVSKGIKKIKRKRIKNQNIIVIVGPCLGFSNFEVDKKFKLKFIKKNRSYQKFFKSKNRNKDIFNLRSLINFQISKERIDNVFNVRKDTYKNTHIFFSHRRATHQNKMQTGRMINIISLRD